MPKLSAAMTIYIYALTALSGLVMGSFLNCFAYRYVNQQSVMKGRSQCALCGHTLGPLDLIPVFSWLFLKGKCRWCGSKISPRYILAEIICALAYVSVLWRFGITPDTLRYLILASLLFAASFADIHGGLIPDRLIVIGVFCAFVFTFFSGAGSRSISLLRTLLNGLSVAFPLLMTVLLFDRIMKKETMGGGDIKLIFLIGLYFDWKLNIFILILACIIGIVFALAARPDGEMHGQAGAFSFGPALALAAWGAALWGQNLLNWYLGFF